MDLEECHSCQTQQLCLHIPSLVRVASAVFCAQMILTLPCAFSAPLFSRAEQLHFVWRAVSRAGCQFYFYFQDPAEPALKSCSRRLVLRRRFIRAACLAAARGPRQTRQGLSTLRGWSISRVPTGQRSCPGSCSPLQGFFCRLRPPQATGTGLRWVPVSSGDWGTSRGKTGKDLDFFKGILVDVAEG